MAVKGFSSQTLDLQQWQTSAGVILTAVDAAGKLVFGASGAQDTNLYRSAANTLKTDDSLVVGGAATSNFFMTSTNRSRQFYLNDAGDFGLWNADASNDLIHWRANGWVINGVKSEYGLYVAARDDAQNAAKSWAFYSSTDKHFAFWHETIGAEAFQLNTTIADTETAMLVRRNVAGAYSLQRVTQGAADSGGAGFKLLRIPN